MGSERRMTSGSGRPDGKLRPPWPAPMSLGKSQNPWPVKYKTQPWLRGLWCRLARVIWKTTVLTASANTEGLGQMWKGFYPASPVMGNLTSWHQVKKRAATQIWILVGIPVNLLGLCDHGLVSMYLWVSPLCRSDLNQRSKPVPQLVWETLGKR